MCERVSKCVEEKAAKKEWGGRESNSEREMAFTGQARTERVLEKTKTKKRQEWVIALADNERTSLWLPLSTRGDTLLIGRTSEKEKEGIYIAKAQRILFLLPPMLLQPYLQQAPLLIALGHFSTLVPLSESLRSLSLSASMRVNCWSSWLLDAS